MISQSKVFNFQLLCQLTRAQATEAWAAASVPAPGEYPWTPNAWQGNPPNSTWHETQPGLAKLHLRRGNGGEERGKGERKWQERNEEKPCGSDGEEKGEIRKRKNTRA